MLTICMPEAQIFINCTIWQAIFELPPKFGKKCTDWPQNYLELFHVTGTHMHNTFHHFRSTMSRFWVTPPFRKSTLNNLKWRRHVLGHKYQHACYLHPRGPNFRPFQSTTSHFWAKSALNGDKITLTCSRSKVHIWMLHTSPWFRFSSVSLYDETFWETETRVPNWLQCKIKS